MAKQIIFSPSGPVEPEKIIGRNSAKRQLLFGLSSLVKGNGKCFTIYGLPGVGKTTLINWLIEIASGKISIIDYPKFNILTLKIQIRSNLNGIKFIKIVSKALISKIQRIPFLNNIFQTIRVNDINIGIGSISLSQNEDNLDSLKEKFFLEFEKIINEVRSNSNSFRFNGILLVFDHFEKLFPNNLQSSEYDEPFYSEIRPFFEELIKFVEASKFNLMIVLAGVSPNEPSWLNIDRNHHTIKLTKLAQEIIISDLNKKYFNKKEKTTNIEITDKGIEALALISKGHPYFLQLVGSLTEEVNSDNVIDHCDVIWGFFHPNSFNLKILEKYKKVEFVSASEQKQLRNLISDALLETFNKILPFEKITLEEFLKIYFERPQFLFMEYQKKVIKFWEKNCLRINKFCKKEKIEIIVPESWKEPAINDWRTTKFKDYRQEVLSFMLKPIDNIWESNYLFHFSDEHNLSIENIAINSNLDEINVWLNLVRFCESLRFIAILFNNKIRSPDELTPNFDSDDENILNFYKPNKNFELPEEIKLIGKTLIEKSTYWESENFKFKSQTNI